MIIIVYFIIAFAMSISDAIGNYRMMAKRSDEAKTRMSGNMVISNAEYDNEEYGEGQNDGLVDEYNEFKRNMARVKQVYADYNTKVAAYQRGLDKEPTDIIDEKLMLREHDEYA